MANSIICFKSWYFTPSSPCLTFIAYKASFILSLDIEWMIKARAGGFFCERNNIGRIYLVCMFVKFLENFFLLNPIKGVIKSAASAAIEKLIRERFGEVRFGCLL